MASQPRSRYRSSGRIDVLRLALALPLSLLLAGGLGMFMAVISLWYTYVLILVPVVLTVPLAVVGYFTARWARVRSAFIAGSVGAVLGATMYVGQYTGRYAIIQGDLAAAKVDGFAQFMSDSLERQFIYDHDKRELRSTGRGENWFVFGMEIGLCTLGTGFGWYLATTRPFCERCGRFMRKRAVTLGPGCGAALNWSLTEGGVIDPPACLHPRAYSRITVFGCTHGGQEDSTECYITTDDFVQLETCQPLELSALTAAEYQAVAAAYPRLRL